APPIERESINENREPAVRTQGVHELRTCTQFGSEGSPGNSSTLPCIYALHFRCDASSDNENIAVAARSQLGMSKAQHVWALILAGGDGSRLRALTTKPCGTAVPKQFCSLDGGRSLLEQAILRASTLVPRERSCTIVAQQHRQWWSECPELTRLPPRNLLVQPRNRGTGIGVLYSVLHILARDPDARIVMLP